MTQQTFLAEFPRTTVDMGAGDIMTEVRIDIMPGVYVKVFESEGEVTDGALVIGSAEIEFEWNPVTFKMVKEIASTGTMELFSTLTRYAL